VVAGRDLNLQAETTTNTSQQQSRGKRFSQTTQSMDETVHGTLPQAGGDIALVAGRDANLTATQVGSTDGGISIAATRDVNLLAAQEDQLGAETTRREEGPAVEQDHHHLRRDPGQPGGGHYAQRRDGHHRRRT
jgi:filamentous hemagglutinin